MKTMFKWIYALFPFMSIAAGALTAAYAESGDLFVSVDGGFGQGPVGSIYRYTTDGVQSTVVSGLSHPRGLGFDAAGDLFVACNVCLGQGCKATRPTIFKITPDGAQTVFATMPVSLTAEDLAIDRSDNVFVIVFERFDLSTIYKFSPDGIGGSLGTWGHKGTEAFGLAFDRAGNLFAADAIAEVIRKFSVGGGHAIFVGPKAFGSLGGPIDPAFDQFGDLFVSTNDLEDNGQILEFTPTRVETTFATGLIAPRGVVFDSAGNLFVTENPASASGDILKFTPDGTRSVFASGIGDPNAIYSGPEFLAFQPAPSP